MKQGKIYMRFVFIALLAAVLIYLIYSAVSGLTSAMTTTTVYEYEVGYGCTAHGLFVRTEQLVGSNWPINVLACADGDKIGAGQAVAYGYQTATAREQQAEREALTERLAQLEYAYSDTLSVSDSEQLSGELLSSLADLAVSLGGGAGDTDELVSHVKGQTLRLFAGEEDRQLLAQQISEVQSRLQQLSAGVTGNNAIQATVSGWFSSQADGYETVLTLDALSALTLADLASLTPQNVGSTVIGRLCTNHKWYFVCGVSSAYLTDVSVGSSVQVAFSAVAGDAITMRVERIGSDENGQRLLVLSCTDYLPQVVSLREQNAELIFSTYTGLRVPKEAIRYEEGSAGVYIIESTYARWKPVRILYDNGESYVVEQDKSSTNNLWAGDEIIVRASNLYDGKVVR